MDSGGIVRRAESNVLAGSAGKAGIRAAGAASSARNPPYCGGCRTSCYLLKTNTVQRQRACRRCRLFSSAKKI